MAEQQLCLWDTVGPTEALELQWKTREVMPGETVYYLEFPEHHLWADVDPCYPWGMYTYFVVRCNADGSTTRIKHWLETGKKHKVSLEEGKRICEEAIKDYLADEKSGSEVCITT